MGTFTREDAWLYLLAFLAWLAGFVLVIFVYGGQDAVVTPAQRIQLAAMFAACALICRTAWTVTRAVEGPLGPFGSPQTTRFLLLFTLRCWAFLLGAGVSCGGPGSRALPGAVKPSCESL